ncbi:MAG: S10 family peptidase [Sphingomonadales bacterium]
MKFFNIIISSLFLLGSNPSLLLADAEKVLIGEPQVSITQHQGRFNGERVNYSATAGETYIKDRDGKPTGSIFSVSYVKSGVGDSTNRPITFFYNGGPGSSSVWLHMGAFGPKRVAVPNDAKDDGAAPFKMVDNPSVFLDVTDIVFIDPVGTGFSKPLGESKGSDFWGVHEDAQSIEQFIRAWLTKNGRWNSPKYIGGESYGTTRSAALIRELEGGFDDVSINGIILVSTILDFGLSSNNPGQELAYMVYLPTMAMTSLYHGKISTDKSLENFAQEARDFAINVYGPALLKGNSLQGEERAEIRSSLAYYTGLSETYLENANLRVQYQRYLKEIVREDGMSAGRLDGRYLGQDFDNGGEIPDTDPSFYGIDGAYTATLNSYIRSDLGYTTDEQYYIIGGVTGRWNWNLNSRDTTYYKNVAPYIGTAMKGNSELRVYNAAGYYDFATPFFGAEYSMNRSGIDNSRVTYSYFEAGHMVYLPEESLVRLNNEIREFIQAGKH